MNANRIEFVKWFRVLMYIAIVGFFNTLVGMLSFIPTSVTVWINRIIMVIMIISMFKLAPANDRYKKAGIHRTIVLGLTIVTEVLHTGAVLTLVGSIFSIVAEYQEYHGHSELIEEKDHQLSGKWSSLFMWSIFAGIILGFTSTAAVMLVALAEMDTMKATMLVAAILAIPEYIIDVLYILYLKKMIALFPEEEVCLDEL